MLAGPWNGAPDTVLATHTFTDGRTINWVDLTYDGTTIRDAATPLVVPPGATIEVEIEVGLTSGSDWRSTRWRIGESGWHCQDTPDHTSDGTYTATFTATAPSMDGTYTVSYTHLTLPTN